MNFMLLVEIFNELPLDRMPIYLNRDVLKDLAKKRMEDPDALSRYLELVKQYRNRIDDLEKIRMEAAVIKSDVDNLRRSVGNFFGEQEQEVEEDEKVDYKEVVSL